MPLEDTSCGVGSGELGSGFISIDGGANCYKLFNSIKTTWLDAQDTCRNRYNADLATITDGFEQSLIRLIAFDKQDPWIGMFIVIFHL